MSKEAGQLDPGVEANLQARLNELAEFVIPADVIDSEGTSTMAATTTAAGNEAEVVDLRTAGPGSIAAINQKPGPKRLQVLAIAAGIVILAATFALWPRPSEYSLTEENSVASDFDNALLRTIPQDLKVGSLADMTEVTVDMGRETLVLSAGRSHSIVDRSTGTWRLSAPGPIEGLEVEATRWTGTEAVMWKRVEGSKFGVGAFYNPERDTWRELAPPETVPGVSQAVSIESAGNYLFLQFNSGSPTPEQYTYNLIDDTWKKVSAPPVPGSLSVGTTNGQSPALSFPTVAWDDLNEVLVLNAIEEPSESTLEPGRFATYDPASDTWALGPRFGWPRDVIVVDGVAFLSSLSPSSLHSEVWAVSVSTLETIRIWRSPSTQRQSGGRLGGLSWFDGHVVVSLLESRVSRGDQGGFEFEEGGRTIIAMVPFDTQTFDAGDPLVYGWDWPRSFTADEDPPLNFVPLIPVDHTASAVVVMAPNGSTAFDLEARRTIELSNEVMRSSRTSWHPSPWSPDTDDNVFIWNGPGHPSNGFISLRP